MIQGEIIGGGSHRYTFEERVGHILTVESRNSVFPQVITPDRQLLTGDPNTASDRLLWRGKLPTTGTYTLELNSNFRGFEYDLWVQIEELGTG